VSRGSITLGDVANHTPVLAVACTRCERAGQYRLDTLIARHGKDFGIPDLLRLLSEDCPKRKSITVYDLCGVHCPELPGFFLSTTDTGAPYRITRCYVLVLSNILRPKREGGWREIG
jgi:hypothetical protein